MKNYINVLKAFSAIIIFLKESIEGHSWMNIKVSVDKKCE